MNPYVIQDGTASVEQKSHYRFGVVIGRFQPFHDGHAALLIKAAELCDYLIVVIGTSNSPRTIKNPFNFAERAEMIQSFARSKDGLNGKTVYCMPVEDNLYSDLDWKQDVVKMVQTVTQGDDDETVLIGFKKDASSYYLNEFPMWHAEYVKDGYRNNLDATAVRRAMFSERNIEAKFAMDSCPSTTKYFLQGFDKEVFKSLCEEHEFIQRYKLAWERAPYPPVFMTVDAVVHCRGYVLMVTRGAKPGKGLLALPGGFVNGSELTETAALRELKEETHLKIDRSDIVASRLFDHPDRSLRGRTFTHAFLFDISEKYNAPPLVKGDDDASDAGWIWIPNLRRSVIFEDHLDIIKSLVKAL